MTDPSTTSDEAAARLLQRHLGGFLGQAREAVALLRASPECDMAGTSQPDPKEQR